ncbi:putative reverse transcriptase domain-containing protein [Tanacetum coccineum]
MAGETKVQTGGGGVDERQWWPGRSNPSTGDPCRGPLSFNVDNDIENLTLRLNPYSWTKVLILILSKGTVSLNISQVLENPLYKRDVLHGIFTPAITLHLMRIDEDTTTEEETKEPVRDKNPPSILVVEKATFLSIQRDPGVRQLIWNYPSTIELLIKHIAFIVISFWKSQALIKGSFRDDVIAFCKKHGIRIPDFSAPYFEGRSLAKKYYYLDFTEQELDDLEFQLKHFEIDMKDHLELGKSSSIVDLCRGLASTRKTSHYYLVDRLIRLVLTLPVSTASVERAFSVGMSTSKEEHEVHLRLVLELLKKEKLYAKFSKCEFWLQEVHFLGHMVNQFGIHVDPSKIEAVKNWKALTTPSKIRSFLGLAGKANVVADALSKKERVKPRRVRAMSMTIQSGVRGMILAAQSEAFKQENILAERLHGLDQQMERKEDGSLYFMDRIWVLLVGGMRTIIMDEAHKTRMKRYIATYVSKCLTFLKLKAEHQRPLGLLQQPEIPEWKWDKITMDFITKLPKMKSGHDTIWVIVDRLSKSAHFLNTREDYSTERLEKLYIDEIVA